MTGRLTGANHRWLCPRHRALIWQDPEAALALWQQLQWVAAEGRLTEPTLRLARWHVALDVIAALRGHGHPGALACLQEAARRLVPMLPADEQLLLRLHQLLCEVMRAGMVAAQRELAGWLDLLEQRLCGADPRRLVAPSALLS